MVRFKLGISQIGGKFRLCNKILNYIPYHEFFLSPFCGACWVELNKPRSRYECWNDINSEIINYLIMINRYPNEFDKMKQGVFGLVSQEICNRIVRGELKPRNNLERAYFFYYLNKLTFGGDVKKIGNNSHYCGIMRPTDPCRQPQIEKVKTKHKKLQSIRLLITQNDLKKKLNADKTRKFEGLTNTKAMPKNILCDGDFNKIKKEWKTKGYFELINNYGLNRVDDNIVKKAKLSYRGLSPKASIKEKNIKSSYDKINNTQTLKVFVDKKNLSNHKEEFNKKSVKQNKRASFKGIANHGAIGWGALESGEVEKAKEQYKAVSYKGLNPKTTRPYKNNDCGLLTPLDRKAIERMRYVNLTCYDFRKVYDLFYKAFHERKGLSRECFIYSDPPFPGTEKYYGNSFKTEDHQDLIDRMLETPFNFLLSIGGKCDLYLDQLKDWIIIPVKVRYSTDATSQKKSQEYLIMNYKITNHAIMTQDLQSDITRFF